MNNKLRDNSVLLNWVTTLEKYRCSNLFQMANDLLGGKNVKSKNADVCFWDIYFPFKTKINLNSTEPSDSFKVFLEFSMYRPRDFVTMLRLIQDSLQKKRIVHVLKESDFWDNDFQRDYSEYLLSEVKDFFPFEYNRNDYELFLKYFKYLEGNRRFNYISFSVAYNKFVANELHNMTDRPRFLENNDTFLQFLYELNVMGYTETLNSTPFSRWCFRERSYSNMFPKVKTGVDNYYIHRGLAKALRLGKKNHLG